MILLIYCFLLAFCFQCIFMADLIWKNCVFPLLFHKYSHPVLSDFKLIIPVFRKSLTSIYLYQKAKGP